MAAQLGVNIPLNIGGTVPWDEIYPEIVKSSNLLMSVLSEEYDTKKYGKKSLREILINDRSLEKYKGQDQNNRALIELRKMININKFVFYIIFNIVYIIYRIWFFTLINRNCSL